MPVSRTRIATVAGSTLSRCNQDAPVTRRELARIVQQVPDDLHQARTVRVQEDRLGRQRHRQLLLQALSQRAYGIHGIAKNRGQVNSLRANVDLAAADASRIQQIINQPHNMLRLSRQYPQCGHHILSESYTGW
jgi:hypothetical protein